MTRPILYNIEMDIPQEQFASYLREAIDNIPVMYKDKLDNVAFKTELAPSNQQRISLGLRPCDALYGLYEGVPLPQRGGANHSILPDIITVFMHPMVEIHSDVNSLRKQIYKTVWHEVAHYFGLGHDRIHAVESSLKKHPDNN
jgi:predicted Zn-dependent protease with MMP-like domain